MTTLIESNGSKWAGQEPDSIDVLLDILSKEPLDATFEQYGNFFTRLHSTDFIKPESEHAKEWAGCMHFFGNFKNLSHVFSIKTFDQDVIVKLIDAIENNKQMPGYGKRN